jgi:hypothetical protein
MRPAVNSDCRALFFMSFATLLQHANKIAARHFQSVAQATVSAWFPPAALDSPGDRAGFTRALTDIAQGPPRIQRDALSGSVLTATGTIRISILSTVLPYQPKTQETVCLIGQTKATALLYRVSLVEAAGGLLEIELKEEAQWLD